MSFRANAKKVRDTELPIWKRLVALRCCIAQQSQLTGESYQATLENYDRLYGFNRYRPRTDPPTEAQLLETLRLLEITRKVFTADIQDEAQRNREAKWARKNAQRASAPSYLWGIPCATRQQFDKTISKSKPTLVSVMAPWDGGSARLSFDLQRWKANTKQWHWLMVDCDQEIELCQGLKIATTPALFVYQKGKQLAQRQGLFRHQGTADEHYHAFLRWLETVRAVE